MPRVPAAGAPPAVQARPQGTLQPPPLPQAVRPPAPARAAGGVVQPSKLIGTLFSSDTYSEIGARIAANLEARDLVRLSRVSRAAHANADEAIRLASHGEFTRIAEIGNYPLDPLVVPDVGPVLLPGHDDPWLNAPWDKDHRELVEQRLHVEVPSFQAYRETVLWPLVRAAYLHMIQLVTDNGMKGERDVEKRANLEAQRVYGVFFGEFRNDCAAVVLRDDNPELLGEAQIAVALNSLNLRPEVFEKLPPSGFNVWRRVKFRLETKFGPPRGYLVIGKPECYYMHAEIRLWEEYGESGKLKYIGIQQPCCLYCAAQLLAAGFKGFPGSHMDVYNQYTFSPKILARPVWRRNLFGAEVASWYDRATPRERADFLREMAEADKILSLDAFKRQDRKFTKVTKEDLSPFEPGYAESSEDEAPFEKGLRKRYPDRDVKQSKRPSKKARTKKKENETPKRQPGPRGPKRRRKK